MAFDGNGDFIDVGTGLNYPAWTNYAISAWFLNDGRGPQVSYCQKIVAKSDMFHDGHLGVPAASDPDRAGRLNGSALLPELIRGVRFIDGVKERAA